LRRAKRGWRYLKSRVKLGRMGKGGVRWVDGGWKEEGGKDGWGCRSAGALDSVCVGRWGGWGGKCGSWLGMGTDGFEDTMPVKKKILGSSRSGISLLGFSSILGGKDQQCCLMAGLAC
jgi:hypothetical protein